jgi:hypothetical protein
LLGDNKTVQFANNGRYLMTLQIQWAANTAGSRTQWIQGSGGTQFALVRQAATPDGTCIMTSADYGAFTTNSVTAIVAQTSGSSVNVIYAVLVIFRIS